MDIITPTKPKGEIAVEETTKKTAISPEERARRKAAVDYARGSVRLEGFILSPFTEDLNRRYIDGELTSGEVTAQLLAHYKR